MLVGVPGIKLINTAAELLKTSDAHQPRVDGTPIPFFALSEVRTLGA